MLVATRAGAVDWAENFGTPGASSRINATAVDASGNVYIAGDFNGATLTLGSATLTKIGLEDAFIVKLDASGLVVWANNFGGSSANTYGQGIAVDGSGNVYLGGDFNGASLSSPALTKVGIEDAFALKLDSSGNPIWANNFGGNGANTYGSAIAVDSSGNVYLGGDFNGAGLTAPALTLIGFNDAFALKLDSSGNPIWANNFGGYGANTYGGAIAVDSSGNVYLGGSFDNANLTTPALTLIGLNDAFALKLNPSGNTLWAEDFGGSGAGARAEINGIAVDGSGNVYLGGDFSGNLTTPALTIIGPQRSNNALVLKLDASGNTVWANNFGGSGSPGNPLLWADTYGRSIAVDGSANVYLGGLNYNFDGGLTTPALTPIGFGDAFALKLDSSGNALWAKNFGGSGALAEGSAIAADGSGNLYLGGDFSGANLTTPLLSKIGSLDALIIKKETVLSDCSQITPSPISILLGNSSPLLTAACYNSPTTFVWSLNGTPVAGCTTSTCTVPSASLLAGGVYRVSVTANNASGTGVTPASTQLTVLAVDLVPTALSVTPATVITGTNLSITDTVQNQGTTNTTTSNIAVNYYLSTDATITTADKLLGKRTIAKAALTAGASSTATTLFKIPASLLPRGVNTGSYYIGEIVDATNAQAETSKTNNTLVNGGIITVRREGVDLAPTAISTTATTIVTGTPISITDTVQNQGPNDVAASIVVNYYLSKDTKITTSDKLLGQRIIAASDLTADASSTATTSFTVPTVASGDYYVGEIVDATKVQNEISEINNTLTTSGEITVLQAGVDLVPTALSTTATTAVAGTHISITDAVQNQGPNDMTAASIVVKYYLSRDTKITSSDKLLGQRTIAASDLTAGSSSTATTSFTIPPATPAGSYYIGEIVDATSQQTEINEKNNTLARGGTIAVTK